ncbi:hypothetical protein Indivirus_6_25 [Indivirus ILV1]|uniref:Uncharacterized protein n=1 Tax=Indivirus ILV1 TaxID=1977633 RepID=A0A1V0SE11_9VIRU|nr:hypothetical protein Indivirus_6_25 [Indivirus ILV1]
MSIELLNELVQTFFKHQIIMKMFHFQTKKYGAHKASDSYLDGLLSNFDKFFEVAQGKYGTMDLKSIKIELNCIDDSTITDHLNKFISLLKEFEIRNINDTSLLNIRDEMLGNAQQLIYLLRFQ